MSVKNSLAAATANRRKSVVAMAAATSMTELSRAAHLQLPSFNSINAISSVVVVHEENESAVGSRREQELPSQQRIGGRQLRGSDGSQRPHHRSSATVATHHHHTVSHHSRKQQHSLLHSLISVTLLALLSLPVARVEALICYETAANGKTTIKQNDSWSYCALVPATMHGSELINGSQFGLGNENDMLGAYNTMFGMNGEDYRVLTVCIYERYDFSRYLPMKPSEGAVEFTFRCICNYDLCNSETTFSSYLTSIKAESFSVSAAAAAAAPSQPRRPELDAEAATDSESTAVDAEERRRR